jgi:hypothetical protein
MALNKRSIPVLNVYWTDLLIQFEKSESEEVLKALYLVEQELKKRSGEIVHYKQNRGNSF